MIEGFDDGSTIICEHCGSPLMTVNDDGVHECLTCGSTIDSTVENDDDDNEYYDTDYGCEM